MDAMDNPYEPPYEQGTDNNPSATDNTFTLIIVLNIGALLLVFLTIPLIRVILSILSF